MIFLSFFCIRLSCYRIFLQTFFQNKYRSAYVQHNEYFENLIHAIKKNKFSRDFKVYIPKLILLWFFFLKCPVLRVVPVRRRCKPNTNLLFSDFCFENLQPLNLRHSVNFNLQLFSCIFLVRSDCLFSYSSNEKI